MARTPRKHDVRRVTVEMDVRTFARLEKIQESTESDSMTETVRRSLQLYDILLEAKKDGFAVLVKKDDKETEIVVF